ncbi:MAG: type II secretion system F family protein [Gammaproteobacteria bacterium]|nr:type II secretion system F family protein [Gammaproteobacteria bacterium]
MPTFSYKARSSQGSSVNGVIDANSSDTAAASLIESGLTPVELSPYVQQKSVVHSLNALLQPKIHNTDLIQFSRQMHSMLRAGIPMFRAISGLAETTSNIKFKQTLREVMDTLESGRTLSDGFEQHPKVFSNFFVSLVRVGETSGKLEEIFKKLAFYLDRDHATRARIKSALRYPCIVIAAIAIALSVISVMVIPAFSNLFNSFGAELPTPTLILMSVSDFMVRFWPAVLGGICVLFYGLYTYVKTETGSYRWDKLKLRLPLIGDVVYKASLARFSHLFSMSIDAGVPLVTSLSVVANALNNAYLEDRIHLMRDGVEQGKSLSVTATSTGIFDPLVLQMLAVGEETGTTGELLAEISDYYDREVSYAAEKLSAAIEPILTVVVGGLLLVMAMGIFLPMWDLASVALN